MHFILKKIIFRLFLLSLFLALTMVNFAMEDTSKTLSLSNDNYYADLLPESAEAQKISGDIESCGNPKTAVGAGDKVYFVWDGIRNGKKRVFFREFSNGEFSKTVMFESDKDAADSEPDIAADAIGNPHIVWVGAKNNVQAIYYAHMSEGKWTFCNSIYETPGVNIESPAIGIGESVDDVYLSWQAGKGINYHIFAAVKNESKNFDTTMLSSDSFDHYNLYPQIFTKPYVSIFWYESIESEFILSGARYDKEQKTWLDADFDRFDKIACNRLPIIMMSQRARLAGIWYDSINNLDKIFLGLQDFNSGAGIPIDANSLLNESQPYGIITENDFALITFIDTNDSQVYFSAGKIELSAVKFITSPIKVSILYPGFYTHPRLASMKDKIILIWSSNQRDGGDGGIYFKIIELSNV